jgi:NADH-quinone oxidoreductase subunit L
MAGPTPVSALIHAATMVTAGVYMVARSSALYLQAPIAMSVVAIIGAATAIFAATIALTSTDIKKVLAYSTVSQLGYMFLACGVGAFAAGIFHLMTHAFFKALLFLGAGSVMHGMSGETRIDRMGGLKKHMPTTWRTFLIGGLALSGIPIFAGFFSKDEILWKAFDNPHGSKILWAIGLIAAGLTAFYVFRMIFMTFYGHARYNHEAVPHVHESPALMTVPLMILAVLSTIGGLIGIPHVFNKIEEYLHPMFAHGSAAVEEHGSLGAEITLMILSVGIAGLGIYIAGQIYLKKPQIADNLAASLKPVYQLLRKKYYVDEIYEALFVRPIHWLSENFFWKIFDVKMIDGLVNGSAKFFGSLSGVLRFTNTGVVQTYALSIIVGILAILGYLLAR